MLQSATGHHSKMTERDSIDRSDPPTSAKSSEEAAYEVNDVRLARRHLSDDALRFNVQQPGIVVFRGNGKKVVVSVQKQAGDGCLVGQRNRGDVRRVVKVEELNKRPSQHILLSHTIRGKTYMQLPFGGGDDHLSVERIAGQPRGDRACVWQDERFPLLTRLHVPHANLRGGLEGDCGKVSAS